VFCSTIANSKKPFAVKMENNNDDDDDDDDDNNNNMLYPQFED
jgi:hypothetical protein